MRTLTQRELNRALPARQLLLGRGRMPLPKALERVGGTRAQCAPSMYIGLWSRREWFERGTIGLPLRGVRAIELAPFGRLDAADRRALKEEADRLAELHS